MRNAHKASLTCKLYKRYTHPSLPYVCRWCKSWNAEIEACDGLATTTLHALLGMKVPFVINKQFIKSQQYGRAINKVMRGDLQMTHAKQIVWEIEEEEGYNLN